MITERILKVIEFNGITKYKFCKDLGLSNGFLDKPREISTDKYANILSYFPDICPEWLLTGNGEMLKTKDLKTHAHTTPIETQKSDFQHKDTNKNGTNKQNQEKKSVYLYNVVASAGHGSFDEMINSENIVGEYLVPEFKNVDFMIYVRGSSMIPKYYAGDIIACKILNDPQFLQWNKIYLIATREQGFLVKRVQKNEQKDFITAVSENPKYQPFDIPRSDIFGMALVIGVIRLE